MIQFTSRVDNIANELQNQIVQGKLNPGDRLPAERSLCVNFGVGRTTIREALKSLAVRHQQLTVEVEALEAQLEPLVAKAAPDLVAVKGIGTDIASTLLATAGDNPDRLRCEGAFAHLCASLPSRPRPARPIATGSTGVVTATLIGLCTCSRSGAWAGTCLREPTSSGALPRAYRRRRSSGA